RKSFFLLYLKLVLFAHFAQIKMLWLFEQDEPVEETLVSQVASLLKRSKSHQYYGLMGRRSGKICCFLEGHKGHMFVGLKGKRSSGGMALHCLHQQILDTLMCW
uniref:Uncharacterized protein n=1 Tax=Cyprinus carpio TaxID=7962 RepID=A0A8C2H908_CYPCA